MGMSFRLLARNLSGWAMLAVLSVPLQAEAQTDAEPGPATRPTVSAKKLLAAAYEKTRTAQSVDDFSHVIEQCERALGVKLSPENAAYAHDLAGWAYNKRGEAYAAQAAALAEGGEERKANELDDVALADFESALSHDPQKWRALHNKA